MSAVIPNAKYEQMDSTENARIASYGVSTNYVGVFSILPEVSMSGTVLKVTEIGKLTFYKCYNITDIIIPDTITTIRQYAFAFLNIERIIFPKSLNYIESFIISDFAPKQIIFCGTKDPTFQGIGNEKAVFSNLFKEKVIVPYDYESKKTGFLRPIIRKRNACTFVPIWQHQTCHHK